MQGHSQEPCYMAMVRARALHRGADSIRRNHGDSSVGDARAREFREERDATGASRDSPARAGFAELPAPPSRCPAPWRPDVALVDAGQMDPVEGTWREM